MTTIDWTRTTEIAPGELPAVITAYLAAHQARDLDAVTTYYTADGVAVDEGRTYHGPEEIRAWLARSASEYTYTITLIRAAEIDESHYDVLYHLEGDFPGNVVDLHFRFTLRGTFIARLVIDP
jgi:ketosteroid isomerase-like protein